MAQPLIQVHDLAQSFADRTIFSHVNFSIPQGAMVSLVGANGSGKTTLTRILLGILKPTSGTVQTDGGGHLTVGYVPQFRNLDRDYPLSVRSFVQLNQIARPWPWHTAAEKRALTHILTETRLTGLAKTPLGMTSGGEKQRAYLAQALVNDPRLLILDEPTASLDVAVKHELIGLVRELNQKQGLTVLFVTHDLPMAREYTDRYLLLQGGQMTTGPASALRDDLIAD
ncbi:metal ABC transporter ATP-binding protein [Schleiferilactobacillus shenzhenensis]|uniref:ABC transporter domain-containing protein n=1 Tax=Schleiferilactobacillus shenzhenensis LY-73 TaxID=1231336 RepID=U4TU98_9LACO|nr:ATP-binding cassette domain-containing protein [Schleiferilactobacillus shenzhenensis]ERL65017.1 hypothetical protein L248_3179 [Schleiferilactobacillus shenzhenensis LY-73]